ncbi:hypothetical protein [uncultured Tateyamaria sp.]|uniref:hypothetical protein n=1 Tax=uncultured Tateyamaria sp. TaxID=455651 RepID=UPI00261B69A1|nr:hypothetical protein [uncultured Tateyamaria sp.]
MEDLRGKIEVSIGRMKFAGEGTQDWLSDQLEKILNTLEKQPAFADEVAEETSSAVQQVGNQAGKQAVGSLANYLKSKNAASVQTKKFLATAGWLMKKGKTLVSTSDVTKALRENHQTKLGNPSESLNQNVSKGFCEKSGKEFFLTPEGWEELGDSL